MMNQASETPTRRDAASTFPAFQVDVVNAADGTERVERVRALASDMGEAKTTVRCLNSLLAGHRVDDAKRILVSDQEIADIREAVVKQVLAALGQASRRVNPSIPSSRLRNEPVGAVGIEFQQLDAPRRRYVAELVIETDTLRVWECPLPESSRLQKWVVVELDGGQGTGGLRAFLEGTVRGPSWSGSSGVFQLGESRLELNAHPLPAAIAGIDWPKIISVFYSGTAAASEITDSHHALSGISSVDCLSIITCHFNPAGYWRPVDNYWRFRQALGPQLAERLITVELSFDGQFAIPDSIRLHGTDRNRMWQKEALINVGLQYLPAECDIVCWIDADVIFLDPLWIERLLRALETKVAVQLFRRMHYVDDQGRIQMTRDGFVYSGQRKISSPGHAWAMRREALEAINGLADWHVLGGGDQVVAHGFSGILHQWYRNQFAAAAQAAYDDWREQAYRVVGGSLACLPGDAVHLYHGTRQRRRYSERIKILSAHGFDPASDVRPNGNGILEWCSDKPELHREVAEYFRTRREDD